MNAKALLLITAVLSCAWLPAYGQSTRERVTMLENNVARLERLLENNQVMQTQLLQRIQELQTENQALRNDIDKLQFDAEQGSDRQRQLYLDLDARLQALESRGGALPAAPDAGGAGEAPAVGDAEAYQAAFDLLKQGDYAEAKTAFAAFLATYADSPMRGNAQYWLAETHYVSTEFETALTEFQKVIRDYPTTRKVPDAWLKIGYCNYELKRWNDARVALRTVVTRYADSTAARLAEQRLTQMQNEGH